MKGKSWQLLVVTEDGYGKDAESGISRARSGAVTA
jgi:hypothetical protein